MDILSLIIAGLAAVAAGMVNAIAGGGTLITFPVLTALGLPTIVANVTNTIALCPGYLGGTFAQLNDLKGQRQRLWLLLPLSVLGGIAGGLLLLHTGESSFRRLVPFLILLASFMLALQDPVRKWITKRSNQHQSVRFGKILVISLIIPAAIYGGYFGAGVSVIILAILGLVIDDTLTRLNALKQSISFSINISAAVYFSFSAQVEWITVLIMAIGALAGGVLGGKLAGQIKPVVLRWIVVSIGLVVAIIYFVR